MILIMGVPYGDSDHDSGKTRAEFNDLMTFEALLAEIQGEQIQNKIKMTDDIHVSMHVSTEDDNIPVMYDDEHRNFVGNETQGECRYITCRCFGNEANA
jgi:hypothetical protein